MVGANRFVCGVLGCKWLCARVRAQTCVCVSGVVCARCAETREREEREREREGAHLRAINYLTCSVGGAPVENPVQRFVEKRHLMCEKSVKRRRSCHVFRMTGGTISKVHEFLGRLSFLLSV